MGRVKFVEYCIYIKDVCKYISTSFMYILILYLGKVDNLVIEDSLVKQ